MFSAFKLACLKKLLFKSSFIVIVIVVCTCSNTSKTFAQCIAPTGLTRTVNTRDSIGFSWKAVPGVDGYEYYIRNGTNGSYFGFITDTSVTADFKIPYPQTRYLSIRSKCGNSYSDYAQICSATPTTLAENGNPMCYGLLSGAGITQPVASQTYTFAGPPSDGNGGGQSLTFRVLQPLPQVYVSAMTYANGCEASFCGRVSLTWGGPMYFNVSSINGYISGRCLDTGAVLYLPMSEAGIRYTLIRNPSGTLDISQEDVIVDTMSSGASLYFPSIQAEGTFMVRAAKAGCGIPMPMGNAYNFGTESFTFSTCLPYANGFNSQILRGPNSGKVLGWDLSSGLSIVTSSINPNTSPYEASRYIMFNSYDVAAGSESYLTSQAIKTTGWSVPGVEFSWYNNNNPLWSTGSYLNEGVQLQYSTNNSTWINAGPFIPRHDGTLPSGTGQWKKKTITLPPAAGNIPSLYVRFKFRSEYGDNCSIDAFSVKPVQPCNNVTWTGTTGTQWQDAANWDCGYIPDAGTSVIIENKTNLPVINNNVSCRSILVKPGAKVTVSPGFKLTVTGQ